MVGPAMKFCKRCGEQGNMVNVTVVVGEYRGTGMTEKILTPVDTTYMCEDCANHVIASLRNKDATPFHTEVVTKYVKICPHSDSHREPPSSVAVVSEIKEYISRSSLREIDTEVEEAKKTFRKLSDQNRRLTKKVEASEELLKFLDVKIHSLREQQVKEAKRLTKLKKERKESGSSPALEQTEYQSRLQERARAKVEFWKTIGRMKK